MRNARWANWYTGRGPLDSKKNFGGGGGGEVSLLVPERMNVSIGWLDETCRHQNAYQVVFEYLAR